MAAEDRMPPGAPRRRPHYTFGSDLSGLNRPREWLGALLVTLAILAVAALVGWAMFGVVLG